MKNKFIILIVAICIASTYYSCSEFISVNLRKKSLTVLAPSNGTISTNYTITFWWEKLKGADMYELQVVQPDFNNIQKLFLDTVITTNKFSMTFAPGDYQWRVRAMNNSSNTDYVNYWFTIDSSLDLASQTLLLLSPANNVYKNTLTHTFSWSPLSNADNYVFQLFDSSGVAAGAAQSVITNSVTNTFTSQGVFKWRVFAQNAISSSPYSERTIIVDTAKPSMPIFVSPVKDTSSLNPIPLVWNISSSADYSHLLISTDSTFTVINTKDTLIANTTNPLTYKLFSATIGTYYYWKVQSIDKAGNVSSYFTKRRITRK